MTKDISYSGDRFEWFEKQLEALRNRDKDSLDFDDLIKLIEASRKSMQDEVKKWVKDLILGNYKITRADNRCAQSEEMKVDISVRNLLSYFKNFPSIQKYIEENLPIFYEEAINELCEEKPFARKAFPEKCEYTLRQLIRNWVK